MDLPSERKIAQTLYHMKTLFRALTITVVLATLSFEARPCTTFCIRNAGQLVFGKNFDFYTGVGHVVVNKRNLQKHSYDLPPEKRMEWISKYGSITFNQVGKEFPYGGINERGLVIEIMWLDDTKYPDIDKRSGLVELQWIQYQLDNSATIEDIIASDSFLRISNLSLAPVHFLACDSKGNVATIEYINGKMVYRTGATLPVCALANNTYDQSVSYSKSLANPKTKEFTKGSNDRFAQAATMVQDYKGGDVIDYSFNILDRVAQGNFTRWSIVYDIRNMTIHYKTQTNRETRVLNVGDFDFSCDKPSLYIDIDENFKDETSGFRPYSREKNLQMIDKAFSQVDFLQSTPKEERETLARYPDTMKCN
jgi:penicillin V acylase-like amidase (Ntn superfamily)